MEKKKFRIVIADDNKDLREIIKDFIMQKKSDMFEVTALVGDGEKAIDAVETQEPDILILDIIMPKIDGRGVLQRLKEKNLNKMPKIFVLSSVGYDTAVQMIIKEGIDYYMLKPFDYNLFLESLILLANGQTISLSQGKEKAIEEKFDFYTLENQIDDLIYRMGVPKHMRGYKYLTTAIAQVYNDSSLLNSLTTKLYPMVAGMHLTSLSSVERTIRAAIEVACNRNTKEFEDVFGNCLHSKKKPTNHEFIFAVFQEIKKELEYV